MGDVFPGGSTQLNALLGKFAVLNGLLVRGSSSLGHSASRLLRGLTPEQLGLPEQTCPGVDWQLVCGGLFYAANDLGEAHAIFQEIDSPEGSYWHGMLHRREGDFSNARYWMRRAGRVAGLAALSDFSPAAFVGACERAAVRGCEAGDLLEIQQREWEAMMQWSWRRLSAVG